MTTIKRALLLATALAALTTACATTETAKGTPGTVPRDGYGQPIQ
jgi:ABC-type glycerol-3-phosphate transport system substrate-binding protein